MRRFLRVLSLVFVAGAASAQAADPLKSVECTQALDALQAREAAMRPAREPRGAPSEAAARAGLQPYRQRVARECLGKEDLAPERAPRAPIAVSPVTSPSPARLPAREPMPPAVTLPPLRTVTQCDPSGCWTSDGLRLNRLGPVLVGPPGACTVQSGLLSCR